MPAWVDVHMSSPHNDIGAPQCVGSGGDKETRDEAVVEGGDILL